MYLPLCGGGWCGVPSKPPRGVPIPPRPRQDRRDSGVSAAVWGWVVWCPLITPTGRPYPSPAQAGPEGLGCIRRCVGWVVWCPLITPTGRPYPSPAQAGPEGLGCIRRCVGASLGGTGSWVQMLETGPYIDMHTAASRMSRIHGRTCGSQRCRNNLKFRNTKHSAKYTEKCTALDATDTVAQPGQVQVDNQLCHTANCRTA